MNQDAAILARAIVPLLETCRVCGCHGDSCSLFTGERCVWVDRLRTLCSNPDCIAAVERLKKSRSISSRGTSGAPGTRCRTG